MPNFSYFAPDPASDPEWLRQHRAKKARDAEELGEGPLPSRNIFSRYTPPSGICKDVAFNRHAFNDGSHVSPYDNGIMSIGNDDLVVRLVQGIDEKSMGNVLRRAIRATNGIPLEAPPEDTDAEEMLRGGLQTALETQVVVFEVVGASRALTHQLVRSRRAAFHQQSQRATWFGDEPDFRMPESVWKAPAAPDGADVVALWVDALRASWKAYRAACDAGVSYQDARYILPEGTQNYILCEYPLREFIAMFAYRGCSMFMHEMVHCVRQMRRVLLAAHPFLEPYIKISCEKGTDCWGCAGTGKVAPGAIARMVEAAGSLARGETEETWLRAEEHRRNRGQRIPDVETACPVCKGKGSPDRKCTFQGWENVEGQCEFPWAKQSNRVFLPAPRNRIDSGIGGGS